MTTKKIHLQLFGWSNKSACDRKDCVDFGVLDHKRRNGLAYNPKITAISYSLEFVTCKSCLKWASKLNITRGLK